VTSRLWAASGLMLVGCAAVKQEPGLTVDVVLVGAEAPSTLDKAEVSVRSVELVPCQMAWSPLDLLGSPARADHSIESPTMVAFSGAVDLLAAPTVATLNPPPDVYCYARAVLEPSGDLAYTVRAEVDGQDVATDRVAWIDLPMDLTLHEDHPHAEVVLTFSLSQWPDAAATGSDVLFETARDDVILTVQ